MSAPFELLKGPNVRRIMALVGPGTDMMSTGLNVPYTFLKTAMTERIRLLIQTGSSFLAECPELSLQQVTELSDDLKKANMMPVDYDVSKLDMACAEVDSGTGFVRLSRFGPRIQDCHDAFAMLVASDRLESEVRQAAATAKYIFLQFQAVEQKAREQAVLQHQLKNPPGAPFPGPRRNK